MLGNDKIDDDYSMKDDDTFLGQDGVTGKEIEQAAMNKMASDAAEAEKQDDDEQKDRKD